MSSVTPLYCFVKTDLNKFSQDERKILEAGFLSWICNELKNIFRKQQKEYFSLMKFTIEMENIMLDANFICLIIKDILSTNEYTIAGIAHYMNVHEDILHEIIIGLNTNPSAILLQRVIDLHRSVRADLYREIINKITLDHATVA
jgi:hypothetical protein